MEIVIGPLVEIVGFGVIAVHVELDTISFL